MGCWRRERETPPFRLVLVFAAFFAPPPEPFVPPSWTTARPSTALPARCVTRLEPGRHGRPRDRRIGPAPGRMPRGSRCSGRRGRQPGRDGRSSDEGRRSVSDTPTRKARTTARSASTSGEARTLPGLPRADMGVARRGARTTNPCPCVAPKARLRRHPGKVAGRRVASAIRTGRVVSAVPARPCGSGGVPERRTTVTPAGRGRPVGAWRWLLRPMPWRVLRH